MVAEQEFRTATQTQTSQPARLAQCVPMEPADVPVVSNEEKSNDPHSSQQHGEPDDWDPDAKLKLKVGDVTVTVKQPHRGSSSRQRQLDRLEENNETFRHETASHEFRAALQQARNGEEERQNMPGAVVR